MLFLNFNISIYSWVCDYFRETFFLFSNYFVPVVILLRGFIFQSGLQFPSHENILLDKFHFYWLVYVRLCNVICSGFCRFSTLTLSCWLYPEGSMVHFLSKGFMRCQLLRNRFADLFWLYSSSSNPILTRLDTCNFVSFWESRRQTDRSG